MNVAMNVSLSTSPEGMPRPQLEIEDRDENPGTEGVISALLHEAAARAIRATQPTEFWTIEIVRWNRARGAVYAKLRGGSNSEIDAALAMLRSVTE
jgi:hypothetical protein